MARYFVRTDTETSCGTDLSRVMFRMNPVIIYPQNNKIATTLCHAIIRHHWYPYQKVPHLKDLEHLKNDYKSRSLHHEHFMC